MGSIIVILATNAPLLPTQCKRLAHRASLGIARVGGTGENSSGDIFLAFSTVNSGLAEVEGNREPKAITMLPNDALSPLFEVQSFDPIDQRFQI